MTPLTAEGKVISVNISTRKGTRKSPVEKCHLTLDGIEGDVHAGDWHRQVSLLAQESIDTMKHMAPNLKPGDFAENITTTGMVLTDILVGTKFRMGQAVLELTQIGKECHMDCEIRQLVGDCVMPREGVFARVIEPGQVRKGDSIMVVD